MCKNCGTTDELYLQSNKIISQYSDEVNDLIEEINNLELDLIDIINQSNVSNNTINKINYRLDVFLLLVAKLIEDVIDAEYVKGFKTKRNINLRDMIVVENLMEQLEMQLTETVNTTSAFLSSLYLEAIQNNQTKKDIINVIKNVGIVSHIDSGNNKWNLHTYGELIVKTASRQANNLGNLLELPNHDLYQVSSHSTSCPICKPFENRVFSRDGESSGFPNIGRLFGKLNEDLPYSLENSWLNIHPNCLHFLVPYYLEEHTEVENDAIKSFSNFESNPLPDKKSMDRMLTSYRNKQRVSRKALNNIKQYKRYRLVLGKLVPNTYKDFITEKNMNTDLYKQWEQLYRKQVSNG